LFRNIYQTSGTSDMSLTLADVNRIAQLARIEISGDEASATLHQLNAIFTLIERMQQVDTSGIEPVSSAVELMAPAQLRLRPDVVSENDRHAQYQQSAPAVQDALYLVPRVL
jgi:aspartyl-tRNA(Asn)/glutamyl-tRNA(Gln) amidotransferase subunit C